MKLGMARMVIEATEPWGTVSALHLVETEVSLLLVSVLNMDRRIFVFSCSFIYAMMINDILNNGASQTQYYAQPAVVLLFVPLIEVASVLYTRYKEANP